MMRYLKLSVALFRYSLSRELMFKANFLVWVIVEFAWFALQLSLIEVIFLHVPQIAGWNKYQMILLIGTSHVVQQVFQFIFMINCMELPENIRTGKLDFALLQPANSQFLASVRKFDPGALVNVTIGLGFVFYAIWKMGIEPSFSQCLAYTFMVLVGSLIHYALMLMIVTVSFWIVRAQGLVYGYYNLFQITRIPKEAFKGGVKVFFTWVIPMLIVANYPAAIIIRDWSAFALVSGVGLALVLLALSSLWFRFARRSYRSASS